MEIYIHIYNGFEFWVWSLYRVNPECHFWIALSWNFIVAAICVFDWIKCLLLVVVPGPAAVVSVSHVLHSRPLAPHCVWGIAGHNLLAQIATLDKGCSRSVGVAGLKTAKKNPPKKGSLKWETKKTRKKPSRAA